VVSVRSYPETKPEDERLARRRVGGPALVVCFFLWVSAAVLVPAGASSADTGYDDSGSIPPPVPNSANVIAGFFPDTVTSLAVGKYHTCVLVGLGSIYCWGDGDVGKLGNGTNAQSSVPIAVTGGAVAGRYAVDIDAGDDHTCAVLDDGSVACWGAGSFGALGTGTIDDSWVPVLADGGALSGRRATSVAAGGQFTCVTLDDGSVACWGYNSTGQVGNGATDTYWGSYVPIPTIVESGAMSGLRATALAAGRSSACALLENGSIACWGYNGTGQLGDGGRVDSSVPVMVAGGAMSGRTATALTAGVNHNCAVLDDGTVACWGYNSNGQLGNNPRDEGPYGPDSPTPVAVTDGALAGRSARMVSAGMEFSCAGLDDGTVACWGWNAYGQLGNGDTADSSTPVIAASDVIGTQPVTAMENGDQYVCTLLDNGAVACWGMNYYGQLGTGVSEGASAATTPDRIAASAATGVASAQWLLLPKQGSTTTRLPAGPRYLKTRARNGTVTLRWVSPLPNGSPPVTGYLVEYSSDGRSWTDAGWTEAMGATVTGLANGRTYSFRIAAVNTAGSTWSLVVRARPYLTLSRAPRSLRVTRVVGGAQIVWSTPLSDGGSDITHYRVQRSTNWRTWTDVGTTTSTNFTDVGLKPRRKYYYRIRAVTVAGSSRPSAIRSVRTR